MISPDGLNSAHMHSKSTVTPTRTVRKVTPETARKLLSKTTNNWLVAQWCNPLTLQPEQSSGVGSKPGRASQLERHDKGSQTLELLMRSQCLALKNTTSRSPSPSP